MIVDSEIATPQGSSAREALAVASQGAVVNDLGKQLAPRRRTHDPVGVEQLIPLKAHDGFLCATPEDAIDAAPPTGSPTTRCSRDAVVLEEQL